MKKILLVLLIIGMFMIKPSISDAKTYVKASGYTSDEIIDSNNTPHNGEGNPGSYCTYCSTPGNIVNHWDASGGYHFCVDWAAKLPKPNMPNPLPSNEYIINEWTENGLEMGCGNAIGYRQAHRVYYVTYVEVGTRSSNNCNHSVVCSTHNKQATDHGVGALKDWKWTGTTKTGKCSTCNKDLYTGKCAKVSSVSPSPTSSPSPSPTSSPTSSPSPSPTSSPSPSPSPSPKPDPEPEPDQPCDHEWEYYDNCDAEDEVIGKKVTAKKWRKFGSKIDSSEEHRRANPYNIGASFSIETQGHIAVDVVHIPDEHGPYEVTGEQGWRCTKCGDTKDVESVTKEYMIYNYETSTPKYTETYHNIELSFEGFTVNGENEIVLKYDKYSSTYESRTQRQLKPTQTTVPCVITSIIADQLYEDDGTLGDKSTGLSEDISEGGNNRRGGNGNPPEEPNPEDYGGRGTPEYRKAYAEWFSAYRKWLAGFSEEPPIGNGGADDVPSEPTTPTEKTGLLYGYVHVKCTGCKKSNCCNEEDRYRIYFDLTPPLEEATHTITVVADGAPETGLVKIGDGSYADYSQKDFAEGESVVIYAKSNEENDYTFKGWYRANGEDLYAKGSSHTDSLNTLSLLMPASDFKLIAKFETKNKYNVTVMSDGNGKVEFSPPYDDGQRDIIIRANVTEGSSISIDAIPDDNFVVDYWELIKDGSSLGTSDSLMLEDVVEDCVIFVHFKAEEKYGKLVLDSNGPGFVVGGTEYAISGKEYPIYAFPYYDATFSYWKEDSTSIITSFGRCDVVIMPEDKTYYKLTAYFNDELYHQVIVQGDGNGKISINNDPQRKQDSISVKDGEQITIKAYPYEGYEFDYWTDELGNIVSYEEEWIAVISRNKVFTAHFRGIGEYNLNVKTAGGGRVYGNVDNAVPGREYPIEAVADDGYEFLYWEDKDTMDITDYAEYDYVVMPTNSLTLVAHFREIDVDNKYTLTLRVQGNGTVKIEDRSVLTHSYEAGEPISIVAESGSGYEFVGWYENNQLISTKPDNPPLNMPHYNMTLVAVFMPASDEMNNSPFRILSIRDVRWKDYFTSNGSTTNNEMYVPKNATNDTILVNAAELVDSSYSEYVDIVYGYAVEFELVTTGVEEAESKLVVIPKLYKKTGSERMNEISIDLGEYAEINSSKNAKKFMITGEQESIDMPNYQTAPQVTWRWVWYLPLDICEEIRGEIGGNSDIVVNFDIYVEMPNGQRYDYIQVINSVNSRDDRSDWGGNVFTYRLDKTLEDDIYNNANN